MGDTITVVLPGTTWHPRVAGVVTVDGASSAADGDIVLASPATVQQTAALPAGTWQDIWVQAAPGTSAARLRSRLSAALGGSVQVTAAAAVRSAEIGAIQSLGVQIGSVIGVLALLGVFVGLFVVSNTFGTASAAACPRASRTVACRNPARPGRREGGARPAVPRAACGGYRMAMKQAPGGGQAGPAQVKIAEAADDDLVAIVGILNYTAASSIARFETRPVSVAERREWFGQFSATGPYRLVVARGGDQARGFACSQRFRDLEAFRETVEVSIALDVSTRGRGVGTALYRALFDRLDLEPSVHVALAGIALPNDASVALHRKFGFTEVGTFCEYAIKNGQYISSVWMQRVGHRAAPPRQPPVP